MGAFVPAGLLDENSLIAYLGRVQEIAAAVVTAKTYTLGYGSIFIVPKRSGDQMLFLSFPENFVHLNPGDLLLIRVAAGLNVAAEHETEIHPGAGTTPFLFLPTAAILHAEAVVLSGQLLCLVPGADIMESQVWIVYFILRCLFSVSLSRKGDCYKIKIKIKNEKIKIAVKNSKMDFIAIQICLCTSHNLYTFPQRRLNHFMFWNCNRPYGSNTWEFNKSFSQTEVCGYI